MAEFLTLLAFAGFVIGIIAIIKDGLERFKIPNRTVATYVTIGAFFAMILFAGFVEDEVEVADNKDITEEQDENNNENIEEVHASENENLYENNEENKEPEEDLRKLDLIEIDDEITFEEDKIKISGAANVEDGALITYEIYNLSNVEEWLEGTIEISDESFKEEIDITDFADGEIDVWIAFVPHAQPDHVIEDFQVDDDDGFNFPFENSEQFIKSTPIELAGSGDTATDFFPLSAGFAVFDIAHSGGSNFIVELIDESGSTLELLINEIGQYDGKNFAIIPTAGKYLLDITAGGSWDGVVTQTISSDVLGEQETISGTGDDVIFIDMESGLKRFEFSHDGNSNFIVMVNGERLLVNEIGDYQGSMTQQVLDDSIYAIAITADGNWEIVVE